MTSEDIQYEPKRESDGLTVNMESDRGSSRKRAGESTVRTRQKRRPNAKVVVRVAGIVLKLLEIIGGLICLGLLRYYYLLFSYDSRLFLAVITTGGFVLISLVFLIGLLVGQDKAPVQEVLINVFGIAMYVATGATSIDVYLRFNLNSESTRVGIVFGALAILTGLIYAVDTFVALKSRQQDDEDDD